MVWQTTLVRRCAPTRTISTALLKLWTTESSLQIWTYVHSCIQGALIVVIATSNIYCISSNFYCRKVVCSVMSFQVMTQSELVKCINKFLILQPFNTQQIWKVVELHACTISATSSLWLRRTDVLVHSSLSTVSLSGEMDLRTDVLEKSALKCPTTVIPIGISIGIWTPRKLIFKNLSYLCCRRESHHHNSWLILWIRLQKMMLHLTVKQVIQNWKSTHSRDNKMGFHGRNHWHGWHNWRRCRFFTTNFGSDAAILSLSF